MNLIYSLYGLSIAGIGNVLDGHLIAFSQPTGQLYDFLILETTRY